MKKSGIPFILAAGILTAAFSSYAQETAGNSSEKGAAAQAADPSAEKEPAKKADKTTDPEKAGTDLERLSPGPAPRLKPPRPKGPDTLDLLPTDPESVVRNKLLPLVPESPELSDPLGAVEALKGPAEALGERIKKERNRTEEATDEMALRVRFRQAYTRALRDGEVQQHWQDSKQANTDYERREALKKYYIRLYGLMRKTDKNLVSRIDREEKESVQRLIQKRVEPTVPPAGAPPAVTGF